jgi:hypothetical protein
VLPYSYVRPPHKQAVAPGDSHHTPTPVCMKTSSLYTALLLSASIVVAAPAPQPLQNALTEPLPLAVDAAGAGDDVVAQSVLKLTPLAESTAAPTGNAYAAPAAPTSSAPESASYTPPPPSHTTQISVSISSSLSPSFSLSSASSSSPSSASELSSSSSSSASPIPSERERHRRPPPDPRKINRTLCIVLIVVCTGVAIILIGSAVLYWRSRDPDYRARMKREGRYLSNS